MKTLLLVALISFVSSNAFSATCSEGNKLVVQKSLAKKFGGNYKSFYVYECSKTTTRISARASKSVPGSNPPCSDLFNYSWSNTGNPREKMSKAGEACAL